MYTAAIYMDGLNLSEWAQSNNNNNSKLATGCIPKRRKQQWLNNENCCCCPLLLALLPHYPPFNWGDIIMLIRIWMHAVQMWHPSPSISKHSSAYEFCCCCCFFLPNCSLSLCDEIRVMFSYKSKSTAFSSTLACFSMKVPCVCVSMEMRRELKDGEIKRRIRLRGKQLT